MWKKFLAASAVAAGIAGILASGNAFGYAAIFPYESGDDISVYSGNVRVCVSKNGGYSGESIFASIQGGNYLKQVVFDSFGENYSCVMMENVPTNSKLKFATPMGMTELGYLEESLLGSYTFTLDLNSAEMIGKYLRFSSGTKQTVAATRVNISFDANGGEGTIAGASGVLVGSSYTLPSGDAMTRQKYSFAGWNTKADGSGTGYTGGETITVPSNAPSNFILYAQWVQNPTTLMTGTAVNVALKSMINEGADHNSRDTAIKHLEFVDTLPNTIDQNTPKVNIALDDEIPVYAYWVANDEKIYINTEASKIYANADSSSMFSRLGALTSLTLPASFDTSNVTKMNSMFYGMGALTSLTFSESFDTSNVTEMFFMFAGLSELTSLTLPENFNTSNVMTMEGLFWGLKKITSLTLPASFDTSSVLRMAHMFADLPALTSLTFSENFNTSNVTDMSHMFNGVTSLTSLTLPEGFNTSNAMYMERMFSAMHSLTSLTFSTGFNTANVISMESMFAFSSALTSLTLPAGFGTSGVTNMQSMFANMDALTSLTLPDNFAISSGTTTTNIYENISNTAMLCALDSTARSLWPGELCSSQLQTGEDINVALKRLVGDGTEGSNTEDTTIKSIQFVRALPDAVDKEASRKVNIALGGEEPVYAYADDDDNLYIHVENGRSIIFNADSSEMFSKMAGVTSLTFLNDLNTSQVVDMFAMFWKMSSLTTLILPEDFDLSLVGDISWAFKDMSSLETLRLPSSFCTADKTHVFTDIFEGIPATATVNRSGLRWFIQYFWPGVIVDE